MTQSPDPIVAIEAIRTCEACPSQWDIRTATGRDIYARYRWGRLRVEWRDSFGSGNIFSQQIGGPLDGSLTYEELRDTVACVLTLPAEEKTIDPLTGLPEDGPK